MDNIESLNINDDANQFLGSSNIPVIEYSSLNDIPNPEDIGAIEQIAVDLDDILEEETISTRGKMKEKSSLKCLRTLATLHEKKRFVENEEKT